MVNLDTYRNGVYTGVEDKVLRLQVVENSNAYGDKRPSIYVVPGTYVAYEDDDSNDLVRLSMTEVIERVAEVLGDGHAEDGYMYISPEINADTTVLIVPSRWDRRLDERYEKYVNQLAYIPFFLVHHHKLTNKKKLKKRMPPVHALRILHDNAVIKKLSAEQLIYIDGGGDFDALAWGDDGLPVDLKDINLMPLTAPSRRRGKKKKKNRKKKKSTRRRKGKKKNKKSSKRKSSKRKKKKKRKKNKKKSTSRRRRRPNSLKVVAKSLAVTVQALKRMRKQTKKARTSRRRHGRRSR